MTEIKWELYEKDPRYENMVAVLLSHLNPSISRLDGAGGDGGRDVQFRTSERLDIYELKSFATRIGKSRRVQVERSLLAAAAHQPDSWSLVVAVDPTPAEEKWFDSLRAKYGFPLQWLGRTWLNKEIARHPEIPRYFLEGGSDEVIRILKELKEESLPLGGALSALTRFQAMQQRLNELDPYYRFNIVPGDRAASERAFPYAALYLERRNAEGEDGWTISVHEAYSGASQDRPISGGARLIFAADEQGQEIYRRFRELTEYGAPHELQIPAESITSDAPGGLGGTWTGGTFLIGTTRDSFQLPVQFRIVGPDGATPVQSLPAVFKYRGVGFIGATLEGEDSTGALKLIFRLHPAENRLEASFSFRSPDSFYPHDLLPVLEALQAMRHPNHLQILLENGEELVGPVVLGDESIISDGDVEYLQDLCRIQDAVSFRFRVSDPPSESDARVFEQLSSLIDGGEIPVIREVKDLGSDFEAFFQGSTTDRISFLRLRSSCIMKRS